jgi:hypothetical protein
MKKKYVIITALFLCLVSCEKVVYINLNSTNPKMIVQGEITNRPGPYYVLLTNSVNYYQPNVFPPVSGALVIVSDNTGIVDTLKEAKPGYYLTKKTQGVTGRTYNLKIVANGSTYTSTSTMPGLVPIDSVTFHQNTSRGGKLSNGFRVGCYFRDPAGTVNYYKLQVASNDTSAIDSNDIRVLTNGLAQGQELSLTYRTNLVTGDTVYVKLDVIDKGAYTYFTTLPAAEGEINPFESAPPDNPVSNITNGGFGYFSAYSLSEDTVITP